MIDLTKTEAGCVLLDYIEGLSEEARDRILQAQDWAAGGSGEEGVGPRCILQHVNWKEYWDGRAMVVHQDVYQAFDRLCSRYGVEEVVPAIKAKAAEGRRISEFDHGLIESMADLVEDITP